jgi:hypothetical protein
MPSLLPSAIIFLQLLLNDKELLGEYANKPWNSWVNWTIILRRVGNPPVAPVDNRRPACQAAGKTS